MEGVTGRVEAIAANTTSNDTIPLEFIWSEKDQPSKTTVHDRDFKIPVIAFDDPDEERLVSLIAKASREIGMFQIINHGIPNDVIDRLQKVGKEFFELPIEEKEKYGKLPGSIEGYGTSLLKDNESKQGIKKGWHDHIFHKIWPPSAINPRFYPINPPFYRETNEEYAKYLAVIADKLFRCLSLGLGLEGYELKEGVGGENLVYLMKVNYYPPCPRPDLALGSPAHTDISAITLLIPNEVPGLQLCMENNCWYDVECVPNAIIIHIGDQMEIMSNGIYKAVYHRTIVSKDKTRFSWPVFLEPPSEHVVGPNSKLVNKESPSKYKTMKYLDFVFSKMKIYNEKAKF